MIPALALRFSLSGCINLLVNFGSPTFLRDYVKTKGKREGRMKHTLSITMGRNPVWRTMAETDLRDFPLIVHLDSVQGQLLGLSKEELLRLKFDESVMVAVSGRRYKFDRLESDGTFKLRKAWE
jgi:hypothetical protein